MRSRQRVLDALYTSVLVMYVVAGMAAAPFHGDESTIIYMSRDWFQLVGKGDLQSVSFRDPPPDPHAATDQQLRLVNGVLSKYAIGLGASLMGWTSKDINEQWLWGADWDFNARTGHIPAMQLLFVSRLTSTLMTALSVAIVFAIGRQIGGRGTAWIGAGIYALTPAVLLNGRRAVFEGATFLFSALVIWVGLILARRLWRKKEAWQDWLVLGAASGLALAAKHTTIIVLLPIFISLAMLGWQRWSHTVIRAGAAALLAIGVFLALNPAWWNAPLQVPREVLRLRQALLAGQTAAYGGYNNLSERALTMLREPFGDPQYYEDTKGWPDWIGGQIATYQASGLAGIRLGILSFLVVPLAAFGLYALFGLRGSWRRLFGAISVFVFVMVFILTPVPWQRYYLPLAVPWAVLGGLALSVLARWLQKGFRYV
jgi:4-amino-4-deoxy-L-arabinose transferase-like glycosyltransferase